MDVSSFLLRVLFLALPGILCFFLYRKLTTPRSRSNWEDFLLIGIFALLSYLGYWILTQLAEVVWGKHCPIRFYDALFDEKMAIPPGEVSWASFLGVLLGFVAAFVENRKLVNRVARKVGVTNRYGDDDVWNYFHNIPREHQWAIVRDLKTGLVYVGWIHIFSDSEKERELILEQVEVFDERARLLYTTASLYVCRDKYDLTIELPPVTVPSQGEHVAGVEEKRDD